MRASIVRAAVLLAVAAMLLTAAACGGSKSSSSSASTDTTPAATSTDTTSTDTTSTDTTSTDTTSTDTTSTDTTSTDTNTIAKSCVNFASAASKLGAALSGSGSSTASSEDLKKYFDGLASKAPGDIKSAFQTLADAVGKYVDGIKGIDLKSGKTPSAADLAKLQSAASALAKPEVQAASKKIQTWVQAGCHS